MLYENVFICFRLIHQKRPNSEHADDVFPKSANQLEHEKSGKVIYNFRTDFLEMAGAHLKTHHVFKTLHEANI